MFKLRYFALQALFLLPLFTHAEPVATPELDYVIVWDVGEVLAHVNKRSMILNDLGISYILQTAWHLMTPQKMRKLMYDIALQYQGPQPDEIPGKANVDDENGKPLPFFMADTWLCSRMPNAEILERVSLAVDQWNPGYPVAQGKRDLVKKTLMTALSAQILGKNTQCIPAALSFVKAFAERGIPQYVLSNFEAESFEVMLNNPCNKELFSYIPRENITVSGICHMVKPHHDVFDHFVAHHKLQGKRIIFIDDQPGNIKAAYERGWTAILLKNRDYAQLAQDLGAAITPARCAIPCA